jgi:hypothetical protein
MDPVEGTLWCDGCGVDMTWAPHVVGGKQYCCVQCAGGDTCECGYAQENEEEGGKASHRWASLGGIQGTPARRPA